MSENPNKIEPQALNHPNPVLSLHYNPDTPLDVFNDPRIHRLLESSILHATQIARHFARPMTTRSLSHRLRLCQLRLHGLVDSREKDDLSSKSVSNIIAWTCIIGDGSNDGPVRKIEKSPCYWHSSPSPAWPPSI